MRTLLARQNHLQTRCEYITLGGSILAADGL